MESITCALRIFGVLLLVLSCAARSEAQNAREGGDTERRVLIVSQRGTTPATLLSDETIEGDWVVDADIAAAGNPPSVRVLFAIQPEIRRNLSLRVSPQRVELTRHVADRAEVLETFEGFGPPPWRVRLLKRGAFYRFWINDKYCGYTFHASNGRWLGADRLATVSYAPSGSPRALGRILYPTEPETTRLGVEFESAGNHELSQLQVTPIRLGSAHRLPDPVITTGRPGSWNAWQVLPAAHIAHEGLSYLYLLGNDLTDLKLEGGGNTINGLATSPDLLHWEVYERPVLTTGPDGSWDDVHVMICGAARTPDGKFAVTYMGWDGQRWGGIGLATADDPAGPFTKHPDNPVLPADPDGWDKHLHVHTLLQEANRYVLMYCGADPTEDNFDKGGLATSTDLVHWTKHPGPVLVSEGSGRFDSMVLRPGSLFRRGEFYYVFYESSGSRPKYGPLEAGLVDVPKPGYIHLDSIGLARSKDLIHWERHPWNPALVQRADFDGLWVAWPVAVPRPDGIYVLYAAAGNARSKIVTGMTRFDDDDLEHWGAPLEK